MFSRLWAPALLAVALVSCGGRPAPTRPATTTPSQVWQDFGLPTARGGVFSLVLHGQRLIAGGTFANGLGAGDVSLLEWSGAGWTPFAIPPPGTVESLASFGSLLIAARSAPGDTATYIEAWDGTRWRSLGDLNHIVLAMTPFRSGLAVGGQFTRVNGNYWPFVAWWDGTHWHNLGVGVINPVHALAVFRGDLVAAGIFWEAGGKPASNIARWDGQDWQPLGEGLDGPAMSLLVHDDRLIVGGKFDFAGSVRANGIATWDGARWQALGPGLKALSTDAVFSLTLYRGEVVAAGRFPGFVARWQADRWNLMPGLGATVFASTVFNDQLVAGGTFRASTRGQPNLIARWVE